MEAPGERRRLELVPAGGVSIALLRAVAAELERRLDLRAEVGAPLPLRPEWRRKRGRIASGPLVDALLERAEAEGGGGWRLALVEAELCAPEGARVFGEAAVGGGCAVVGLGAFGSAKGKGETTYLSRAVKAAVHEVAHAAGLEHCANPACVMYPSRDIADTDRKAADLCAACRELFSHATLDAARI